MTQSLMKHYADLNLDTILTGFLQPGNLQLSIFKLFLKQMNPCTQAEAQMPCCGFYLSSELTPHPFCLCLDYLLLLQPTSGQEGNTSDRKEIIPEHPEGISPPRPTLDFEPLQVSKVSHHSHKL